MAQATTDQYPAHLFPEIDPDSEYQFSVVEGQQSGRPYWMLNLTVQDIKRMFAEFLDRAQHDPRSLAQRSLNTSRARKLSSTSWAKCCRMRAFTSCLRWSYQ